MAEPTFSKVRTVLEGDDDLPRTLRRERDAQARRAREQELAVEAPEPPVSGISAAPTFERADYPYDEDMPPVTVTRLDIPFTHLMMFFVKAVVAGIPALILLLAILWGIGEVLTIAFPELIKMQVLIRMPPG